MKNELKNSQEVDMRSCFSLFHSLTTNKPSTSVTLQEVYRLITTDVSLKESTEKYRYFRAQGFDADADKIKRSKCWVFTPAARFNGKRHGKNLVEYTQYSMVDIDKLEDGEAEKLIKLLKDDSHWLLAYITLSGKGLRIIFKVEGVLHPLRDRKAQRLRGRRTHGRPLDRRTSAAYQEVQSSLCSVQSGLDLPSG